MSTNDIPSSVDYQINKSSSKGITIGIMIAIGVTAFFAGMYVTNVNSNYISQEELDESISKLELKMLQDRLDKNQPMVPVKISSDNDPVIGSQDAAITIIEFSDFQCPFCARFHIQTLPIIMDEYINEGKVKLVFRDFPIQSIHPNAVPASVAAECANEQEKFKEMHDILFERQNEWNNQETSGAMELFNQYAREMELKQEQFESCLTSAKYVEEIKKDLNDGRTYGITGTPGFFIGNDEIGFVELKGAQPFESFKKVIDNQLKN
jgi:protein-disulfide isomerase